MSKLVIELQMDCVNPTISYAALFQKAYFTAHKLGQKEMADFLRKEIDGYGDQIVPKYRYINAIFKAKSSIGPWKPIIIPSNSPLANCLHIPVKQGTSEIELFLNSPKETIISPISAELHNLFGELNPLLASRDICAHFSKYQYKTILEIVKRKISEWAIDLEPKDVSKEEFDIRSKEKDIAKNTTIINNYGNINGSNVVGSAINSTLNANGVKEFDYEGAKKLLKSIKELIKVPSVDENDRNLLNTQIEKIGQKINQKDSKSIGTLLNSLGVWAQSITCSVIGSDIYSKIDAFLKTVQ
ncbi:hypothetical protein [Fibrobacter sp. UWH4]|uniref:AbiTii domain-containing protein n=1 Tax=Fibrobacter sp. UWH4 TaxID=1896210 RepID=UPI00091D5283|nr:hypothetical protein [Fibrobacter sp. UWH4]SHL69648.1 hypothetical protein SAMN05720762_11114 [Fibrobacter sp. UWH4]